VSVFGNSPHLVHVPNSDDSDDQRRFYNNNLMPRSSDTHMLLGARKLSTWTRQWCAKIIRATHMVDSISGMIGY
jgi:hypothetical protein